MSTIQERVARGSAWLDEVRPGWRDAINLDTFDIRDSHQCACGQTFALDALSLGVSGYWFALDLLDPDYTGSVGAYDYGFLWDRSHDDEGVREAEADALTSEWCRVIHAARLPALTNKAVCDVGVG